MPVKAIQSKEEFDRVITSGKVILVDFYADWCGPCQMISPVFEELAEEHAGQEKVEFYKVDIDKQEDTARAFGISSIPAFHAFKDGKPLGGEFKLVGANKAALKTLVANSAQKA